MKNIKLLVLTLLIIGLSANTYAGDKIGIRAGWQYSNIYNGSSSLGNSMSSFYLGVFKEKTIVPLIKIGFGLDYSQAGTQWNDNNSLRLHQLNIPFYAKLKLGPVYALAGVAPTIKIAESWNVEENTAYKSSFDANTFDLPVFGGIGFSILMLRIEARYYVGTIDISGNVASEGYKNQYLQLGLALSI